jgi:Domain of unknown function (DUF5004)
MKHLKKLFYGLVLAVGLYGCSPKTDFAPLGESTSVTDQNLIGTWKLSKVMQIDPIAKGDGKPNEKFVQFYDLAVAYPDFTKCQVSFTGSSYTVTNPSNVPLFLGAGGSWKFVDNPAGRRLDMAGTMVDFGEFYRLSENKLTLVYRRMSAKGDVLVHYFYYFSK